MGPIANTTTPPGDVAVPEADLCFLSRTVEEFTTEDTEDTESTEVEVSFDIIADGTGVTLVHSGWQDSGKAAVAMRKGYEAGWQGLFALRYGAACQTCFRRGLILA